MLSYVPLEEAAAKLHQPAKALLKLGASGDLPIHAVPNGNWRLQMTVLKKVGETPVGPDFFVANGELTGIPLTLMLLKVSPTSLTNFLAYPDDATVDYFEPVVAGKGAQDLYLLLPPEGAPLLMKDCHLVVRQKDLEQMIPTLPKPAMPRKLTKAEKLEREAERAKDGSEAVPGKPLADTTPPPPTVPVARSDCLSAKEIAEEWGIAESTFYNRRKLDGFPKPMDIGGRTRRWKRSDLDAWEKKEKPR